MSMPFGWELPMRLAAPEVLSAWDRLSCLSATARAFGFLMSLISAVPSPEASTPGPVGTDCTLGMITLASTGTGVLQAWPDL